MPAGVRYFWLRDRNKRPVACVASQEFEKMVIFSIASHNPMDKFNKVVGRDTATRKLATDYLMVDKSENIKTSILANIAKLNAEHNFVSTRAINAARYQLETYDHDPFVIKVEPRVTETKKEEAPVSAAPNHVFTQPVTRGKVWRDR